MKAGATVIQGHPWLGRSRTAWVKGGKKCLSVFFFSSLGVVILSLSTHLATAITNHPRNKEVRCSPEE